MLSNNFEAHFGSLKMITLISIELPLWEVTMPLEWSFKVFPPIFYIILSMKRYLSNFFFKMRI